ncbi:MAG TPA: monooxygenase [Mycobacteriales bacterium]|nr:monooxygenase [Mycobacteriales bacterium]
MPDFAGQPAVESAPLVVLQVWTVALSSVPHAIARMALDRRPLRRTPGLSFSKLLGTGDGQSFTVRDADVRRWGLLSVWASDAAYDDFRRFSAVPRRWTRIAVEEWAVSLRPLSSRGEWSGRAPFGEPIPRRYDGPVAAITRARIRPTKAMTFWKSVPAVSADLRTGAGLRWALGIGEAPIGLQGTFSLWDDAAALRDFAYGRAAHTTAITRTAEVGWYAEELFARFAVEASCGTVDGRDPARV